MRSVKKGAQRAWQRILPWWVRGLLILGLPIGLRSEPYLPRDGGEVLEKLRAVAFDPATHEMHELRSRLAGDPGNAALACQLARCCLQRSRTDADPRFLGRAQSALAPWWDAATPPIEVLVLRATIKQSQHDFTNALADLDLAARLAPRNPQVWLTRATILTVLGQYAQARQACLPLAQLAPGLIALTALANIASLNGGAEAACGLLQKTLAGDVSASVDEKIWALTALAEAEARLGHLSQAEAEFKAALALGQHDPYLLGAYADLLLDEDRAAEVADLLKNETRADALLLRLALAESVRRPSPAAFPAHVASLSAQFEAGHLRGDFVHQREEARFVLRLLHQPREALRLAQANWQVQREPADVRILLESALAAADPDAAQPALEFMRTNHLKAVQLASLAEKLNHP
jgi:tetratricopeptide (TPR) repeat protein